MDEILRSVAFSEEVKSNFKREKVCVVEDLVIYLMTKI